MKVVIESGSYYNKDIKGTFTLVSKDGDDGYCKRDHYVRVINPSTGKEFGVQVFAKDVTYMTDDNVVVNQVPFGRIRANFNDLNVGAPHTHKVDEAAQEPDLEALGVIISERFEVMEQLTETIIQGTSRSLIISGAPGVSKTYTLEKRLREAKDDGEIDMFSHIKGRVTPLQLFVKLYEHKGAGQILLLDDVDVFSESDSLDLLKAALDTGATREITWASTLRWLEDNDIPMNFEFEGSVIFITNKNFDREINKNTSASIHYRALISRCHYLDLKVHSNIEILIRVKQIARESALISEQGLTVEQGEELIEWLETNLRFLREISIRSVLKLAQYMKARPTDWKRMATVLLNKG